MFTKRKYIHVYPLLTDNKKWLFYLLLKWKMILNLLENIFLKNNYKK